MEMAAAGNKLSGCNYGDGERGYANLYLPLLSNSAPTCSPVSPLNSGVQEGHKRKGDLPCPLPLLLFLVH